SESGCRCRHRFIQRGEDAALPTGRVRRWRGSDVARTGRAFAPGGRWLFTHLAHYAVHNCLNLPVVHYSASPASTAGPSFWYFTSPPTSQVSTMAMITASHGRRSVKTVCRAELPVATITTSSSPAPTASAATT